MMEINWKSTEEREAFETSVRAHKERIKKWGKLETLRWIFGIFILNGLLIIGMYGSAAYILITEAWETKAAEEEKMKEAWIAARQVNIVFFCLIESFNSLL